MDGKRIEDIERLLQKMREENLMYRENKQNLYSKQIENEDDEEDHNLPSRYREMEPAKNNKKPSELDHEDQEDSDEEVDSEEEARERLKKRLDELKNRKTKLGPPVRVKDTKQEEDSEEEQPSPKAKPPTRPTTAKVIPSYIPSPMVKRKKNDPVSLFQQRQKEWKANTFLRSNTLNTREGRKLNLASTNHPKDFEVKKKDVHEYIRNNYTAPHEKRRDDIRFQTRVKMMTVPENQ